MAQPSQPQAAPVVSITLDTEIELGGVQLKRTAVEISATGPPRYGKRCSPSPTPGARLRMWMVTARGQAVKDGLR